MPLLAVRGNGPAGAYGFGAASQEQLGGMVLITPTSVAKTGTTATINANGSVSCTALSLLELRGVFSAAYDNYTIVVRATQATSNGGVTFRVLSGTSAATGSDYYYQYLYANDATLAGGRTASATSATLAMSNTTRSSGFIANIYGPYLAQPTVVRSITVSSENNAMIEDYSATHGLSTSYDGCSLTLTGGTFSGLVSVYALVGA